jgi:hypothetical protein
MRHRAGRQVVEDDDGMIRPTAALEPRRRPTRAGLAVVVRVLLPTTKKAARTSLEAGMSSTKPVTPGSGPLSKVRLIVRTLDG